MLVIVSNMKSLFNKDKIELGNIQTRLIINKLTLNTNKTRYLIFLFSFVYLSQTE